MVCWPLRAHLRDDLRVVFQSWQVAEPLGAVLHFLGHWDKILQLMSFSVLRENTPVLRAHEGVTKHAHELSTADNFYSSICLLLVCSFWGCYKS